jgi:hypothetical protein
MHSIYEAAPHGRHIKPATESGATYYEARNVNQFYKGKYKWY